MIPQPKLTEQESRALAKHIVQEMFRMLTNDENVGRLAGAWAKYLDQWIGKNFRRLVMFVFMAGCVWAAIRFELWTKLFDR